MVISRICPLTHSTIQKTKLADNDIIWVKKIRCVYPYGCRYAAKISGVGVSVPMNKGCYFTKPFLIFINEQEI